MHRNQRRLAIAERRQEAAWYYLKGCTQAEIAAFLGCCRSTITKDLAALQRDWRESALRDFDAARSVELAKIDHLERRYWQAWERSCLDEVTTTRETAAGSAKWRRQQRGQSGNPAFLAGVQWCITKRCELLGLDPPKRTEISGPSGGPIGVKAERQYSDAELVRILEDAESGPAERESGGPGAALPPPGQDQPD